MLRDGTVERIANEICMVLASSLGPNTDCHVLRKSIETAVLYCMMDSPHCQQLDDARARLVSRIRREVDLILESHHIDRPLLDRLQRDIEQAVHVGLGGNTATKSGSRRS